MLVVPAVVSAIVAVLGSVYEQERHGVPSHATLLICLVLTGIAVSRVAARGR